MKVRTTPNKRVMMLMFLLLWGGYDAKSCFPFDYWLALGGGNRFSFPFQILFSLLWKCWYETCFTFNPIFCLSFPWSRSRLGRYTLEDQGDILLKTKEMMSMGLSINDSVYSCVFFFLTGLHFFHLVVGLLLLSLLFWSCSL
jgi:hypothetical protein